MNGPKLGEAYTQQQGTPPRYNVPNATYQNIDHIVNGEGWECERANLERELSNLKYALTENDFLFVFVFSHGVYPYNYNPLEYGFLCPIEYNPQGGYNQWDFFMADEFAQLINQIPAYKKVLWINPCYGGGFAQYFDKQTYPDLSNIVFNSACDSDQVAHEADDQPYNFLENESYPGYDIPTHHSEFLYHLYSATIGKTPFGQTFYTYNDLIPLSDADENEDGVISVFETADWENQMESMHFSGFETYEDPVYKDDDEIGAHTSLMYPTVLFGDQSELEEEYRGMIGISLDVTVSEGQTLTFGENSEIYFLNDAKLYIQNGGSLVLENNVRVYGKGTNWIEVNGSLSVGPGVSFSSKNTSGYFNGIIINNSSASFSFDGVSFYHTLFESNAANLSILNSTFDSCSAIHSTNGNITISGSTFEKTEVGLRNDSHNGDFMVTINGCNFHQVSVWSTNIYLENYQKYYISGNDVNFGLCGILLQDCGSSSGNPSNYTLFNNDVSNCFVGISTAFSIGIIKTNYVHNNIHGISCGNYSSMSLAGNQNAQYITATQLIMDNDEQEIIVDGTSFPYYFKYNGVVDEDNIGGYDDCLLLWDSERITTKDVRDNCWGWNFDPAMDFFPVNCFLYEPTWCPTGLPDSISGSDETLFYLAEAEFDSGNYLVAKENYIQLVELYPKSNYAQASLKKLYKLEASAGQDYSWLKEYYLSNDSILNDTLLYKVAKFLANKCNINLENWAEAISWYESVILNPETLEDSVYAIIDLEKLYLFMSNLGTKSIVEGNLKQFIPQSYSSFKSHSDSLRKLLPGRCLSKEMIGNIKLLSGGELLQNVPNPFTKRTEIWYKLDNCKY